VDVKTLFVPLRAALWAGFFVWIWLSLARAVRRYDAGLFSVPSALMPLGYLAIAAGGLLVLACLTVFVRRGRGTAAPFDPPREFVAVGPYRFVRNPMYLGAALVLAGLGLIERSASVLLLSFGLLLAAHLFVILVEEPGLEERFGETYESYKRTVHRWIPRRPPRAS
jgi:protein-S-isoprenylcysteine O-methyltransferase Ste14